MSYKDIRITKKQELYNNFLKELPGIKLTLREVDIISCIIHNRGEKKVAALLGINYRTVSAHSRNIMLKFNCNSKDGIIDAIESSGKILNFREYYKFITIEANYTHALKKIKALNKDPIKIIFFNCEVKRIKKNLLDYIIEQLNLVNIKPISSQQLLQNQNDDKVLSKNIYIIQDEENIDSIEDSIYITFSASIKLPNNRNIKNIIAFDNALPLELLILNLIGRILNKAEINEIITSYELLVNSWGKSQEILTPKDEVKYEILPKKPVDTKNKIYLLIFILIVTLSTALTFKKYFGFSPDNQIISQQYINIENDLNLLIKNSSQDKIIPDLNKKPSLQKALNIAAQFEKFKAKYKETQLQQYFKSKRDSKQMVNFLYILHVTAATEKLNDSTFKKSSNILTLGKRIIEEYIKYTSSVAIDFGKSSKEEQFAELEAFEGFAEMYTKILYTLGTTCLQLNELEVGAKYLQASLYMGERLNLLEGVLSNKALLYILEHEAINLTEQGRLLEAQKSWLEIIQKYDQYRNNTGTYIQYIPNGKSFSTRINHNIQEKVVCTLTIISCYINLIINITDKDEWRQYTKYILDEYLGKSINLLQLAKESTDYRLKAIILNNIGYSLLQMHALGIDIGFLKEKLYQHLNFNSIDDLELIEEIFYQASIHSKNSDIVKIISYNGLINVFQAKLNLPNIEQEHRAIIVEKMKLIQEKRNFINNELGINQKISANMNDKMLEVIIKNFAPK